MKNKINQLLGLRPGEAGMVFLLGFLLVSNSMALAVSNTVSVSGFLSEVGVNELLIVWIADMLLLILATGLQSLIVDRFERVTLLRWMTFIFALTYVILRLMFVFGVPGWFNYTLLFLLTDQQWMFFPLIFWILANDIFDMAQSKRLFPVIASGSFIGRVVGFGIAAAAPSVLKQFDVASTELLSMNVLIYLIAYLVIAEGLRSLKVRQTTHRRETVREALTEGWGFVREVPSFRYLMLAMVVVSVAFTIVEFHFLVVSDEAIDNANSFQTFYSLFNLGATVAAIAIQSLLTSRIINKINLQNTFLIYPLTLLIGLVWLLIAPESILMVVVGLALPKLMKETIDQSSRTSFQALVPEERRGRVSMFMDSYLFATGAIISSLLLGAIILAGEQWDISETYYVYLAVAAATTLLTIWFALKMRGVYDASLLNWRLKRRQRGAKVLDKLDF